MKILICEDENISALLLKDILLEINKEFEVLISNHIIEATKFLSTNEFDLLFLDIELGKNNSFELFDVFDYKNLNIVFVSSHHEYALNAFKVEAIDFILKPISSHAIKNALAKVDKKLNTSILNDEETNAKILVWEKNKYIAVNMVDIVKIKSSNQYSTIYFYDEKTIIQSSSLKDFEKKLNMNEFVRIHDSCIINLKYVKSYYPGINSRVELINGNFEKISRRRKEDFLNKYKK